MPIPPFIEMRQAPVSGTYVSGSNTLEIDPYRQGVEIRDPRMRLLGTLPKINAGTDNHQIPQTSFGQSSDFRYDTPLTDITTLAPATYVGTSSSLISYPLVGRTPSFQDLDDLDGVLEPLAIRHKVSMRSVDRPFESHDVFGQVMGGNEDSLKRTDAIVDIHEFPTRPCDPFKDISQYELLVTSSVRFAIITPPNAVTVKPFAENRPASLSYRSKSDAVSQQLLSVSCGMSGSHAQDVSYIGFDHVSTVKGFEYQSSRRLARQWTDSIAFGDREAYMSRGLLASRDQLTGSYPTVKRTGDASRTGEYTVSYNDRKHITFNSTGTFNVGRNLQTGSYFLDPANGYLSSNYVRSPVDGVTYPFIGQRNINTPTTYPITTESNSITARPGIADVGISFTPGENPGPFNESRIFIDSSSNFFITGTNESEFAGFGSRLASKTQIKIDLTAQSEHKLYRISTPRIMAQSGANTPEFAVGSTGFAYFNHVLRKWEDIGLVDHVTGLAKPYDYCVSYAGAISGGFAATGTNNFPCQFSMSPQTIANGSGTTSFISTNRSARLWGYDKIGTPTNACFAPFATMYHATASQGFQLKNLIKHPFALEAVVLKIPVIARKIHHIDTTGIRSDNDQRRDIDNYTFFMYRQARIQDPRHGKDSAIDVSGSIRNLICSASIAYWNKPTVSGGYSYASGSALSATDLADWPLHKPAFSYDWNAPISPGPVHGPYNFVGSHTGTLTIMIKPAVVPFQPHGASSFPAEVFEVGINAQKVAKFQNFWAGATNQLPFMGLETGFTGKAGLSASISVVNPGIAGLRAVKYDLYDPSNGPATAAASQTVAVDARSFRSLGGGQSAAAIPEQNFSIFSSLTSRQSIPAPYILMPTDELIFGFDAGISQFRNGASLGLTGSFLQILSSEASVTLFGSLIREGAEYHNTLNQNLTSHALHEAIYSDDVIDQFEIEDRTTFSGSYIDDVITGSMSANYLSRGISKSAVALPTANTPGSQGSLFRGAISHNYSERYLDTIAPNLVQYLSSTNRMTTDGLTDAGNYAIVLDPPRFFIESGTYRLPFPYNNDFERQTISDRHVALRTDATSNMSGSMMRRALFKIADRGRFDSAGNTGVNDHAQNGAMGFRYGMMNTEADFPRAIFRFNKFGQFRDMLEQRLDSKFKIEGDRSLNTRDGINQGPIFIKFAGGDPYKTHSSNMSIEATSSLPYFDGVVRNRETNIDLNLLTTTMIEIL